MRDAEYFERFFEEKELPYVAWEVATPFATHHISNEVVIEAIKNASPEEQKAIRNMLVRIDFKNGDVNHYLAHLAQCMVATMESSAMDQFAAEAALN